MQRSLLGWRECAREGHATRGVVGRMVSQWNSRRLVVSLRAWRQHADDRQWARKWMVRVVRRSERVDVYSGWRRWREFVSRSKAASEMAARRQRALRVLMSRLRASCLSTAFGTWQGTCERQRWYGVMVDRM